MLKSTRIALSVLLLASVFATAQRFAPNAVSPRRRAVQKQDYRTADFAVVLPADAAPATQLAAAELSQHLGKALGKAVPVGQNAPEPATALILGDYALGEKHGLQREQRQARDFGHSAPSAPQRRISACATPSWSSTRATTKSTMSSTLCGCV